MSSAPPQVVAMYTPRELVLDAGNPTPEWQWSQPVRFFSDWQGKHPDPELETEVRVLWSDRTLYIRFVCRFRELFLFADSDPNGRRDQLWDRDVAEAFLQPETEHSGRYREFEVSPNGMWIDLDIFPGGRRDLKSGMRSSVVLDEPAKKWSAEMAIPLEALTRSFDPGKIWRTNFYRVEGKREPRTYLAWQPTFSEKPNFHVPARFGSLRFARD